MNEPTTTATDPEPLYAAHVETLRSRTEAALARSGHDGLIILAGDLAYPPGDDVALPFRVEPHFAAWLPVLEHPGCGLRIVPGCKPVLAYPISEDFWHAPQGEPTGHWTAHFDIRITKSAEEARRLLEDTPGRCATIGDRAAAPTGGRAGRDGRDESALRAYLDYFRAVKTPYEAACLRLANGIAARGHAAAKAAAERGESELAIHQRYLEAARRRETELPYPSIVAINEHASVLHYERLDRATPGEARSFLLDAGAQHNGYAADVTRTWTPGASRFAALIESVDALQQTLCGRVAGDVDFVELNDAAHRLLADVLAEHGLVKCSAAAAYESGITRVFLPHGLGHLIGLQVHDVGGHQASPEGGVRAPPAEHPYLRLTRVLEPGTAVTIEPGLYFIPSLLEPLSGEQRRMVDWTLVRELSPYGGIRVEDDVVAVSDGCRNLTREAFALEVAGRSH